MVATSTRIDPWVIRTRKLLLDAFLSPMAEKSFDEITVQDIAARATVNRATFYAHFVDKYALVDELIREGFTQMLQQRMATRALSIEEHLLRGLILRYRFSDEAQEAWQNDGENLGRFAVMQRSPMPRIANESVAGIFPKKSHHPILIIRVNYF